MLKLGNKPFHALFAVVSLAIPMSSVMLPQIALAEPEAVTFTLINSTSRELREFYVSPPGEESWGDDILGDGTLGPGEEVEITIDDGREECDYDIMGVLGPSEDETVGEGSLIHSGVNICDGDTYEYFEE